MRPPTAETLREQAIGAVRARQRESPGRSSRRYWTSPTGYNYGRWSDRGFNIAVGILRREVPRPGETAAAYVQRVMASIAAQRDEYRADMDDEDGACSGALDAALWAVRAVASELPTETNDSGQKPDTVAPDARWEVWYRDMFDRETPPSVDVRGIGLVNGLKELWARHLCETVQANGSLGFSRFHLRWDRRHVTVEGPWEGAVRLRQFVFGSKRRFTAGYVKESDPRVLAVIATTHARLTMAGRTSEDMLDAAVAAADWPDLEARLASL
jgi:hypothetical protein